MVLDYRDRVLSFVKSKGPVLPMQIAKEVGTNSIMASAMLSELASKKTLLISHIKVGGSPLYYAPGQEPMLEGFANNLNEKDRRVFEFLRQKKVIRDAEQDTLTRVCLRMLKDFAIPLNVTHENVTEIFWKWHTLPEAEAESEIKRQLGFLEKPQRQQTLAETSQHMAGGQNQMKFAQAAVSLPEERLAPTPIAGPVMRATEEFTAPKPAKTKKTQERPVENVQKQTILEDSSSDDPFFQQIQDFCKRNNIKILEHFPVAKKKEYDLVIEVPSPVGGLIFYAKSRNKKRITNADLDSAFVQGQFRKLPVMFLAPGDLSKKGEEHLRHTLRGVNFTKIC